MFEVFWQEWTYLRFSNQNIEFDTVCFCLKTFLLQVYELRLMFD